MTCQSGKVGFVTQAKAHIHRKRLERKHTHDSLDHKFWSGPLVVYPCKFCGAYHVGHATKGRVAA